MYRNVMPNHSQSTTISTRDKVCYVLRALRTLSEGQAVQPEVLPNIKRIMDDADNHAWVSLWESYLIEPNCRNRFYGQTVYDHLMAFDKQRSEQILAMESSEVIDEAQASLYTLQSYLLEMTLKHRPMLHRWFQKFFRQPVYQHMPLSVKMATTQLAHLTEDIQSSVQNAYTHMCAYNPVTFAQKQFSYLKNTCLQWVDGPDYAIHRCVGAMTTSYALVRQANEVLPMTATQEASAIAVGSVFILQALSKLAKAYKEEDNANDISQASPVMPRVVLIGDNFEVAN